jgi:hypothetical protein
VRAIFDEVVRSTHHHVSNTVRVLRDPSSAHAPYTLKDKVWTQAEKDLFAKNALRTLDDFAPGFT